MRLTPKDPADRVFLASLATVSASWLTWWLAFYPGVLSPDSLEQWKQAQYFAFDNWHPYLYALILSGFKHITYDPSTMGLVQLGLTALLVSSIVRYAYTRGVRPVWLSLVVAAYALHPQFGEFNVTIWKDILFSISLFAQAFLTYLVITRRRDSWWPYVTIGLLAGMSVSLRTNGIVNLVLPAVLLLAAAADRRRVGALVLATMASLAFFSLFLFDALNVRPALLQTDQLRVKAIGAIYSDPGATLTQEERQVFERIMPATVWKSAYDPGWANVLFFQYFQKQSDIRRLTSENIDDSRFYAEWKHAVTTAVLRNPIPVVRDKAVQARQMMAATEWPETYLEIDAAALAREGYPRVESVKPWSRFRGLRSFYSRLVTVSSEGRIGQLLWSPLPAILAYVAILLYAAKAKLRGTVAFASVVLLNLAFVIAVSPAADYRYTYFVYLSVFAAMLLTLAEVGETVPERGRSGSVHSAPRRSADGGGRGPSKGAG
jgi:hypothetical protein